MGSLFAVGDDKPQDKRQPRRAEAKQQDDKAHRQNVAELLQEWDTNKDGSLERNEVRGFLRDHFNLLDANKDGKLSREELEQGGVHLQPKRRPSDMVFVLIEMTDCDEDCACEIQRIYESLSKIDKNRDGKLDPEELKASRQQIVEERVAGLFKDLDQNKDGKLSKDEARGQVRRHFNRLDTNQDGSLSREELLTAAAEKPERFPQIESDRPSQNERRKDSKP
jgi:Ca2+-binding EF-hand superfamily protein